MTNEELAVRVQGGERDLVPLLWTQVERFVRLRAMRRAPNGAVDQEDLYQSGFLALLAAVESFDPSRGMSFIGWMVPHLKTAFNEAMGTRSDRQKRDPIHRAASLDAPICEDGDDTLADLVADSAQDFQEAEDRLWKEELRAELERALNTLPEAQGGMPCGGGISWGRPWTPSPPPRASGKRPSASWKPRGYGPSDILAAPAH